MSVWRAGRNARVGRVVGSTVMVAALLGVAACVHDKGAAPLNGNGTLHVVNASPDAGPVDVLVDNSMAVSAAAFLTNNTLAVPTGTHSFAVNDPAGTTTAVVSAPLFVSATANYDLVLAGPATSTTLLGGQTPPPVFDLSSVAAFRVINAVADTGSNYADSIDVYFTDSTGSFTNPRLVYPNVHFGASPVVNPNGVPIYFSLEPGKYHIKFTKFGDTTHVGVDSTVVVSAGQQRTLILAPSTDRKGGNVVTIPDAN